MQLSFFIFFKPLIHVNRIFEVSGKKIGFFDNNNFYVVLFDICKHCVKISLCFLALADSEIEKVLAIE